MSFIMLQDMFSGTASRMGFSRFDCWYKFLADVLFLLFSDSACTMGAEVSQVAIICSRVDLCTSSLSPWP